MSSTLSVSQWLAGRQLDQDDFNEYATVFSRLMHGIGAEVVQAVNTTSIPDQTTVQIPFDTVVYDNDGCWNAASPTRLTAQTPGWYWVEFRGGWGSTTGQSERSAGVTYNATTEWGQYTYRNADESTNAHAMHAEGTCSLWLNVGDYIELSMWQNSSATRTTDVGTPGGQSMLRMTWKSN